MKKNVIHKIVDVVNIYQEVFDAEYWLGLTFLLVPHNLSQEF